MSFYPDVKAIRRQARADWERQERHKIAIQERIGQAVPWALVVIAGVFFALSAPHTAGTFDQLTPGWGWVAPIGVELGLLYAAFRRRQAKEAKHRIPAMLRMLEALLFVTAVIVNGAGAFTAAVNSTGLGELPLGQIIDRFGSLPATSQVALTLAPISALIIPIGTSVAGEGVAALIFERRQAGSLLDQRWEAVGAWVEFYALRDAALDNGLSPSEANRWAARITGVVLSTTTDRLDGHGTKVDGQTADTAAYLSDGQPRRTATQRQIVLDYLSSHPEARTYPVRKLAELTGASKSTVHAVLREKYGVHRSGDQAESD